MQPQPYWLFAEDMHVCMCSSWFSEAANFVSLERRHNDHKRIRSYRPYQNRVLFKGNSVLYFVEVFNYSSEAWLSKFVWFSMPAYILNFEAIISCLRVYNICMHDWSCICGIINHLITHFWKRIRSYWNYYVKEFLPGMVSAIMRSQEQLGWTFRGSALLLSINP